MSTMASLFTSLTIVYSTVYWGADQRKYQSSASLAFVRGIHRWLVNSPHKGPVTRKMFPFDDVIMSWTVHLSVSMFCTLVCKWRSAATGAAHLLCFPTYFIVWYWYRYDSCKTKQIIINNIPCLWQNHTFQNETRTHSRSRQQVFPVIYNQGYLLYLKPICDLKK